jgi:tetratricopeptide (TPR) repeat protein
MRAVLIAAGVAVPGVGIALWGPAPAAKGAPPATPARAEAAATRDQDIAFYERRVARDAYGARDRAMLAGLLLARGRATGNELDYRRAERLARRSYATRHRRNAEAASLLAAALMAQHRFPEAHQVARELVAGDSADLTARATLGEIALELGRYGEADSLFGSLGLVRTRPAVGSRYARWLELHGRSGEARALLDTLRAGLAAGFRTAPEQLAWFDLRSGELAFRNGRADLAEAAFARGLRLVPDDPRLLTALAQLRNAQGRWHDAIELADRALTTLFDPVTLMALSEAHEGSGDSARAGEFARAVEVAVSHQPGAYHRGWALFLLDRHRRVGEMRARALAELQTRRDVYGYDVAAWALHQDGLEREAMVLADSALRLGTRDAMLHYHAGMIALSLADSARARTEIEAALAINPIFQYRRAAEARTMLDRLGRGVGS